MTTAPTPLARGHPRRRLELLVLALVILVGIAIVLIARDDGSNGPSQAEGSGVAATQTRDVAAFGAVELAGANNVIVNVGGDQAVVVRGDDNLLGLVTTTVANGRLVIGNSADFSTKAPMRVEVTAPSIERITLSGAGNVAVDGIEADRLVVEALGAGMVQASGTADRLDARLAGAGDIFLHGLVARDAVATLSGTGQLEVNATRTLKASVSGTGAIVYTGDPDLTSSVTGTGSIEPG